MISMTQAEPRKRRNIFCPNRKVGDSGHTPSSSPCGGDINRIAFMRLLPELGEYRMRGDPALPSEAKIMSPLTGLRNRFMGNLAIMIFAAALPFCLLASADEPQAHVLKHVKVYYEKGRFGGWPANHGIWSWGNEILVGFSRGYYKDLGDTRHNIDREKPEEHIFARSLDGGETWTIEFTKANGTTFDQGAALQGIQTPGLPKVEPTDCSGGIEFTNPNFAMTVRMTDINKGPSRFYYSYDRGHEWKGPFNLPSMGLPGIAARTAYLIDGPKQATFFLTATKSNDKEGRPFCARTTDGGATFQFVSWIGPEPEGYSIMPASVRLSPNEILTAIRCRAGKEADGKSWIEAWSSADDGKSWTLLGQPVPDTGEGNPPALIRLRDGRVCLTYGVRAAPYRICAKLSADGGHSWSKELVLRDDGGNRDLGYTRSLQRPDGKIVTLYYMWDRQTGPERYIAATIWDAGKQ